MADVIITKEGERGLIDSSELETMQRLGWAVESEGDGPGMVSRAAGAVRDAVTGGEKNTAEVQDTPDISMMPEMRAATVGRVPGVGGMLGPVVSQLENAVREFGKEDSSLSNYLSNYIADLKTGVGAQLAGGEEQAQIVKANNPGVTERRDDKGNIYLTSPRDGREYAVRPSIQPADIVRGTQTAATYVPAAVGGGAAALAGKLGPVVGGLVGGGLTGAAVQGSQALTGGSFDADQVAIDAAAGAVPGVASALGRGARGVGNALIDAVGGKVAAAEAPVVSRFVADGAADATEAALKPLADAEFGALVKDASRGSVAARETLAAHVGVDKNVAKAAEDLGIDLPIDIMSQSRQMREAAGIARAKAGSEAGAVFSNKVDELVAKADDVMAKFDANPSAEAVSGKVLDSVRANAAALKSEASNIYQRVASAVPDSTRVNTSATASLIKEIENETGGQLLSSGEKILRDIASNKSTTYGALSRAREQIGNAIRGLDSPFSSARKGDLKRLYGALKDDQIATVERMGDAVTRAEMGAGNRALKNAPIPEGMGGKALARELRKADVLTGLQKRAEERMVNAFGKQLDGTLQAAMSRAAKGDAQALTRLKAVVPKEIWKETFATSIASTFRKGDKFALTEWATAYDKLRQAPRWQSEVVSAFGEEGANQLKALAVLGKRVGEARALRPATGKANQMLESMEAQSLINKILGGNVGSGIAGALGASVGGSVSGGVGAMAGAAAGPAILRKMMGQPKPIMQAVSDLITDKSFVDLAVKLSQKEPIPVEVIEQVAKSSAWRDYAKKANLPTDTQSAMRWLTIAVQSSKQEGSAAQ